MDCVVRRVVFLLFGVVFLTQAMEEGSSIKMKRLPRSGSKALRSRRLPRTLYNSDVFQGVFCHEGSPDSVVEKIKGKVAFDDAVTSEQYHELCYSGITSEECHFIVEPCAGSQLIGIRKIDKENKNVTAELYYNDMPWNDEDSVVIAQYKVPFNKNQNRVPSIRVALSLDNSCFLYTMDTRKPLPTYAMSISNCIKISALMRLKSLLYAHDKKTIKKEKMKEKKKREEELLSMEEEMKEKEKRELLSMPDCVNLLTLASNIKPLYISSSGIERLKKLINIREIYNVYRAKLNPILYKLELKH